jgi:hypothetical protein
MFLSTGSAQESVWRSYLDSGRQAMDRGDLDAALRLLTLAEKEADTFPTGDTRRTQAWHSLAIIAERQFRYAAAEGYYKKGIALIERSKDQKFLAHVLTLAANHYRLRNDYDQAEALYKRALALREKANGPNAWETGQLMPDLADNHRDAGRTDAAEALYKQALKILETHKGREYHIAFTLANLAELKVRAGQAAEAEALVRQSLATYDKQQAPVPFNRGLAHATLAEALRQQKRLDEAAATITQALALLDEGKALPARTLTALATAAKLHRDQNKPDDAKALEDKAAQIEAQHKEGKTKS